MPSRLVFSTALPGLLPPLPPRQSRPCHPRLLQLLSSSTPFWKPSSAPSSTPSTAPSSASSITPFSMPSSTPSSKPSTAPSSKPSSKPSTLPSTASSSKPSSRSSTVLPVSPPRPVSSMLPLLLLHAAGATTTAVRWAGHNRWSQVKRDKAVHDQRRSQAFTKVAKEIVAAVKVGGPDPSVNSALASALLKAKDCNMPKSNMEHAINRGLGKTEGELERIVFEATGPKGVAILVETLTDKRTRTLTLLRTLLHRHGCVLGTTGSVSWMFKHQGVLTVVHDGASPVSADALFELAVDAGALDVVPLEDPPGRTELWCAPADVQRLRLAVEARGLQVEAMDIVYVPHTFAAPLQVTGATGNAKDLPPDSWETFHSLITQIDDLDDVIRVNHNHPDTPDHAL